MEQDFHVFTVVESLLQVLEKGPQCLLEHGNDLFRADQPGLKFITCAESWDVVHGVAVRRRPAHTAG